MEGASIHIAPALGSGLVVHFASSDVTDLPGGGLAPERGRGVEGALLTRDVLEVYVFVLVFTVNWRNIALSGWDVVA